MFLSNVDSTVNADSKRWFPFDTSANTATDLFFRGYAAALKSDATLTLGKPAKEKFAAKSLNKYTVSAVFDFPSTFTTMAKDSTTSTGTTLISFKLARDTYGGTCCVSASGCTDQNSIKSCDLVASGDAGKVRPFATQVNKFIAHSYTDNSVQGKLNALLSVKFNAVIDLPAYLTSVRGKGGWGSTQKLMDMFWTLTSSASSTK